MSIFIMLKHSLAILLIWISLVSSAQTDIDTARSHFIFKQYVPQATLDEFNLRQQLINRCGMYALSGWALGNIVYGSIASGLNNGEGQIFHASNAIWGGINLCIALPGVVSAYQKDKALNLTFGKTALQQHGIEKLYLINSVLDIVYIGTGAAAWGFSDRVISTKNRNMLSGGGKSFILQGGFLALFDWTMYIVHSQHAFRHLNRYIGSLSYEGNGLSYKLQF
jgi:hypothetical protein